MVRVKKDAKALNINIATNIYNKLELYCEDVGQSKTTAVERFIKAGVEEYFEKQKNKKYPEDF